MSYAEIVAKSCGEEEEEGEEEEGAEGEEGSASIHVSILKFSYVHLPTFSIYKMLEFIHIYTHSLKKYHSRVVPNNEV